MKVLFLGGTCEIAMEMGTLLMEEGHSCVFSYRSDHGRKVLEERFGTEGYEALQWSLEEPQSIAFLMNDPPDVVIDLAHERFDALWVTLSAERIAKYFTTEVAARAYTVQTLVKGAIKHKKPMKFVYVSSMAVPNPNPGQGLYAAAKAASEELYRTLALELASRKIYATVVRLGYVQAGRALEFLTDLDIALDMETVMDVLGGVIRAPGRALSGQVVEIPTRKVAPTLARFSSGTWKTPSPFPQPKDRD